LPDGVDEPNPASSAFSFARNGGFQHGCGIRFEWGLTLMDEALFSELLKTIPPGRRVREKSTDPQLDKPDRSDKEQLNDEPPPNIPDAQ